MKKALLDTNIVIHREARSIVRQDIGLLFRWLDKLHYEKCIHAITTSEISRHEDSTVRDTMGVKLESYNELQTTAPSNSDIERIMESDVSENDRNDTLLLSEVHASRVDCLITEDKAIHRKAEILQIQGRVFSIEDFLSKVTAENPELTDYKFLSVRQSRFGELDIDDQFFDSFKKDYKGFSKWFNSKAEKIAYASKDVDNHIVSFLYLKTEQEDENYSDIQPTFSPKKRLKIGTFKVSSTGYKLGERFLKIIFDNALENQVDEIYVTIFESTDEHLSLIALLEAWGFVHHGTKETASGTEQVYVKDFRVREAGNIKFSYPFISGKQRKFIVPIYPEYHTDLLPDSILTNEKPEDFLAGKGHRNAIQKVYISRSLESSMCHKDIIVFYRTGGLYRGVITTIGVVDSVVEDIPDSGKFIELCRKRSVFSDDELLEYWNWKPKNRPFIVNFLYVYSFPAPRLNLARLIELGIIADTQSVPRGFVELFDEKFNLILEYSNAKTDFIVD